MCRMPLSAYLGGISRSATAVKICAAFLRVTARLKYGNFLLAKIFQPWPAICPPKISRTQQEVSVTSLFPMFMKLEGRSCLVVGAGKVGEPKIGGLLETGARIRVVTLDATAAVREWARMGRIELELRAFTND